MLISRISGCKGNGFYLIRKELLLIYFPQPTALSFKMVKWMSAFAKYL